MKQMKRDSPSSSISRSGCTSDAIENASRDFIPDDSCLNGLTEKEDGQCTRGQIVTFLYRDMK